MLGWSFLALANIYTTIFFYSSSGDEITLLEGNFVSHLYPWTKT
jgi:hypothetical protein